MTESLASYTLGKPLRSMNFEILISPQVHFRSRKKIDPDYENNVSCAFRNIIKPSKE
jgi:hypothetical protein